MQQQQFFQSKMFLITLISSSFVLVLVGAGLWYKNRSKGPKVWKKVGELSDIMCFPVKSCGAVREVEIMCTQLGPQKGFMRDRTFMVVDKEWNFVTGRKYPTLVKVSPKVKDMIVTLSAPGMMDQTLDIEVLYQRSYVRASVWDETLDVVDCGEEVAKWFSRFILGEDTGLRLVYYPHLRSLRQVREKNVIFKNLTTIDGGALPDCTSYMLVAESSIADLNKRLKDPVTPLHFRPNFVVKGSGKYDEDRWDWMRIGNVIFQNVKPCTRCIFTTVDPETGIKDKNLEPLKTLKKYRKMDDPKYIPATGDSPIMGIHLGLRSAGIVKVGDPVFVYR